MNSDTLRIILDSALINKIENSNTAAMDWKYILDKGLIVLGAFITVIGAVVVFWWSLLKEQIKDAFDNDRQERKEIHALCHQQFDAVIDYLNQEERWFARVRIVELYNYSRDLDRLTYLSRTDIANSAFLLNIFLQRYLDFMRSDMLSGNKIHAFYIDMVRNIEQRCVKMMSIPKIANITILTIKSLNLNKIFKTINIESSPGIKSAGYDISENITLPKGVDLMKFQDLTLDFHKRILKMNERQFSYPLFQILRENPLLAQLLIERKLAMPLQIKLRFPNFFDVELSMFDIQTVEQIGDFTGIFVEAWYCPNPSGLELHRNNVGMITTRNLMCEVLGAFKNFDMPATEISLNGRFLKIKTPIDVASEAYKHKKDRIERYLEQGKWRFESNSKSLGD